MIMNMTRLIPPLAKYYGSEAYILFVYNKCFLNNHQSISTIFKNSNNGSSVHKTQLNLWNFT